MVYLISLSVSETGQMFVNGGWLWMWKKAFSYLICSTVLIFSMGRRGKLCQNWAQSLVTHTGLLEFEDKGTLIVWNVRSYSLKDTVSYPRRQYFGGDSNLKPLKCNQKPPCFSVVDEELCVMGRKLLYMLHMACDCRWREL